MWKQKDMLCGAKTLENGESKTKTRKGGKCWRHKDNTRGGDLDEKTVQNDWQNAFVLHYVDAAIDMTDDVDKYKVILEPATTLFTSKRKGIDVKANSNTIFKSLEPVRTVRTLFNLG
jgi:hypothetical protein